MTGSQEAGDAAFNCPNNRIACADNIDLGGSTICVDNVEDCPVTDIFVSDDPDASTNYPTYTRVAF